MTNIERICVIYGSKEMIDRLVASESWSGGMLGNAKDIQLIEINPKTEHFKDLKKGILKGFEE